MAKLNLTKKKFNILVDLLRDKKTEEFINYFNNGCKNIDFICEFKTPDLYSATTTILFVAGNYRNIEAMKCLIKNGANINAEVKNCHETVSSSVFNELCSMMNYANICDVYEQYDVDDYSFMKFCLENGADPNWKDFMTGFQYILSDIKDESMVELFINYGADLHEFFIYEDDDDNNKIYVLETLCENKKLTLESKLVLINKIKRSYTDEELYNLSKRILESDLSDKDDVTKELDTIESNDKSAAKIKIA